MCNHSNGRFGSSPWGWLGSSGVNDMIGTDLWLSSAVAQDSKSREEMSDRRVWRARIQETGFGPQGLESKGTGIRVRSAGFEQQG